MLCATFDVTHISRGHNDAMRSVLDTVQDFLIKLGIIPCMHLWKISIFSLKNVIISPTKIMNGANNNWARVQKTKYFKNQSFQIISLLNVDLHRKKIRKILLILMLKDDFESRSFAIFEELFIILVGLIMTWFIKKMFISKICIRGLMPNLIKKSWTVSK